MVLDWPTLDDLIWPDVTRISLCPSLSTDPDGYLAGLQARSEAEVQGGAECTAGGGWVGEASVDLQGVAAQAVQPGARRRVVLVPHQPRHHVLRPQDRPAASSACVRAV